MAGYFQRHDGHVYEGAYKAGETLENGVFAEITANGVKKITAAGDAEFRIEEKTTLWGLPAVRLTCTGEGTKEHYFVENEIENYGDKGDFNDAEYSVPEGHYVKRRRANINDQLIMTVDATAYASLNVGDTVSPAAGGSIA